MRPRALLVVMPVYNEEASIRKVVSEWFAEIENWTDDFVFLAIDDGSNDSSLAKMQLLAAQLGPRFMIHSRANRGHGQSCMEGYRRALQMGAEYVFQIDSDGQCDPQYFFRFWQLREKYDVIYGVRSQRDDGALRILVSRVLRIFILVAFFVDCPDANVPYRLMRTGSIAPALARMPASFFLANAGLAVLLAKDKKCRHAHMPIGFRARYGGEPTVKSSVFAGKAIEFYREMTAILKDRRDPFAGED